MVYRAQYVKCLGLCLSHDSMTICCTCHIKGCPCALSNPILSATRARSLMYLVPFIICALPAVLMVCKEALESPKDPKRRSETIRSRMKAQIKLLPLKLTVDHRKAKALYTQLFASSLVCSRSSTCTGEQQSLYVGRGGLSCQSAVRP